VGYARPGRDSGPMPDPGVGRGLRFANRRFWSAAPRGGGEAQQPQRLAAEGFSRPAARDNPVPVWESTSNGSDPVVPDDEETDW
jgi:hypothetical protein